MEVISGSWNRHLADSWNKLEMQMGMRMADRLWQQMGYEVPILCLLAGNSGQMHKRLIGRTMTILKAVETV